MFYIKKREGGEWVDASRHTHEIDATEQEARFIEKGLQRAAIARDRKRQGKVFEGGKIINEHIESDEEIKNEREPR